MANSTSSMNPPLILQAIPVLNVRGTYHTVGYAIGRTFRSLIQDAVSKFDFLEETLVPAYEKPEGRELYDHSVQLCSKKFPGYVQELEGIAQGSEIPFHKLFLLHIDNLIVTGKWEAQVLSDGKTETGCTDIMTFLDKSTILGHSEDCSRALRNNVFVVTAEIENEQGEVIEKFSTLTYAGYLPGGTMGYNSHGLLHSMNTLVPVNLDRRGTPVLFIMRALLGASSLEDVATILKDTGTGSSDGFSVNIIFFEDDETEPVVMNIEGSPGQPGSLESDLDVFRLEKGSSYAHCNRYLRQKTLEHTVRAYGSTCRQGAIATYTSPYNEDTVKTILSDQSTSPYPIFRDESSKLDSGITAAVGIFNLEKRTWSIYTDLPKSSKPVAVLPLNLNR